ncbi:polyprenyl synthetase family protein [Corynebacterium sp. 320]|uniref:Polyprenyl synthetase family protein n=1 Tax=Corynebacterium zhongnanshanii TaxID=2768834 RepID=A0ABQ6VGR5_9CORY|nr:MULTISPECIES: polyprenyl synthetase family protein [Corynebacterium]KAB1502490.1 polyprenyl synthetase family protein [Corynebacterium sp. 320]KAB1551289.1 polyprenyl synthetase family protein [Corynebacterium sp. 321]KAB1551883.1 polyprenyl synthetase family protein [Corynebacterium sp. 319]KAB3520829.1 polyprenyl synthetase family protein [Corynebacterium zhongnanshanii]KAB3526097.1 polyprenyl synthetase family protein [Corynebacterium sp. 250]
MSTLGENWTLQSPLQDVPQAVNTRLHQYFVDSHEEFSYINPLVSQAITVLSDFVTSGGKRVRPTFAWAGVKAGLEAGGHTPSASPGAPSTADNTLTADSALTAISSLEFIQACALIHDDIIDKSDTRRGHPTAHRTFERQHSSDGWLGDSAHYGISQAILIGDLALAWADDMFTTSGIGAEALRRSLGPWRAMRTEVISGQMLDIALEANGSEFVEDSMDVITYKTASYTVARPLHIGASIAGAPDELITRLRRIGHDIGVAFQLRDDQLGVFGDPDVTGKPSGDDLRSGKRTTLINFALEQATPEQERTLRAHLGTIPAGDAGEDSVNALRQIIHDTGAASRVESLIDQHSSRAIELINTASLSDELTQELSRFARTLTHRTF